jgi:hypothetical protein
MTRTMPDDFDVFLSHGSRDKPQVEKIGEWLQAHGLRVWLDKWVLRPGFPWQEGLEEGVRASRAVAVFVGTGGLGAWQEPEMRAFVARSRREKVPVIPVLLPECPDSPQLTLFLESFTWVDLRGGVTEEGLSRLLWGITGEKPRATASEAAASRGASGRSAGEPPGPASAAVRSAGPSERARARRTRWSWGVGLSLLGAALTLAAWLWPRPPPPVPQPKPAIYAVRVQVLDPRGHPVADARVRTSAGNEPHLLPDGWWEIQVPAAKVPLTGLLTVWVDHQDWEGNHADLLLADDPNPRAEIRLKEPETWLRGRVFDARDRPLPGARVSRQDGAPGVAISDAEGRFALKLPLPPETRVALRAEHPRWPPRDVFCYTGRDSCTITMETR